MSKKRRIKRDKTNKNKPSHKNYKENIGTKLTTNTKKHKLKIQSRVWNFRYTMLYKRRRERKTEKKVTKIILKKGTKLITNTKKLKLKIQSKVWNFKNTMLKKRGKKRSKNYKKYIYMKFALKKIGSFFFFCKVIVGYKSEN